MELVWFIGIGVVAGWLAGQVLKGFSFGLVGNIIIGGIGAVLGRFIFQELGIVIGIDYRVDSLIIAFAGAVILLLCLGFVKRLK